MDFDLTEEQRLLKSGIERLLEDHYDFNCRTRYMAEGDGWSRDQWKRYAEMGLLALPFAESDGGLGGSSARCGPHRTRRSSIYVDGVLGR